MEASAATVHESGGAAMTTDTDREHEGHLAGASRPLMNPPNGIRRVKLSPHEIMDAVTATEDLFVLAHLGVPRVDPAQWSLTIDGLAVR